MDNPHSLNKPSDENIPEQVIANWVNAVEDFQELYVKLTTITQPTTDLYRSGQATAESQLTLAMSMKYELKQLLEEVEQLEKILIKSPSQTMGQLIGHTQRLNTLCYKVRFRLQFVHPSSY